MRAGYDRVYTDTRRPIIPDLPLPVRSRSLETSDRGAETIADIVSVIFFFLLIGIASSLVGSRIGPAHTELPRHLASVTMPDGGRDQSTGPTYPNTPSRTP